MNPLVSPLRIIIDTLLLTLSPVVVEITSVNEIPIWESYEVLIVAEYPAPIEPSKYRPVNVRLGGLLEGVIVGVTDGSWLGNN